MRRAPHRWWTCAARGLRWLTFCARCGLVPLGNVLSQAAVRAGCEVDDG